MKAAALQPQVVDPGLRAKNKKTLKLELKNYNIEFLKIYILRTMQLRHIKFNFKSKSRIVIIAKSTKKNFC